MVQFLLKLLQKENSCCAPRFPLILKAEFHTLYVKESEILERSKSESDILPPTPQPWWGGGQICGASYKASLLVRSSEVS